MKQEQDNDNDDAIVEDVDDNADNECSDDDKDDVSVEQKPVNENNGISMEQRMEQRKQKKDFQDSNHTESTGSHNLQDQEIGRSEQTKEKKCAESDTDYEHTFRGKRYPHCDNANVEKEDSELLSFIFTQFLLHDGLKKFGKKGLMVK